MTTHLIPRSPTVRTMAVLTVLGLAAAGAFGAEVLSSAARFTDSQTTSAATVSTGTLALTADDGASAGSWVGSVSLVPGDEKYAGLTITNAGSLRMRYSVTALSSSPLAATLRLGVVALGTGTTSCTAATFAQGSPASALDEPFGATPALELIGSDSAGPQPGDRVLAAGDNERLCLRVGFPTGAGLGAAARGTSASTTFVVTAESA